MSCLKDMNLGMLGKKMTFLIKFYEIRALIRDNEMEKAARLFVNLIDSHLVSSHFNFPILRALRPLLVQKGLFGAEDIYKLMEVPFLAPFGSLV